MQEMDDFKFIEDFVVGGIEMICTAAYMAVISRIIFELQLCICQLVVE